MHAPDQPIVLSPSDIGARAPGPLRVAGRIAVGRDQLRLYDAYRMLDIAPMPELGPAEDGFQVVIDGMLADGRIIEARLVSAHPGRRGPETRRLTGGLARNLRARAAIMQTVRSFFERRGYLEVETPGVVPSPGMDLHLDAIQLAPLDARPPRFLATSPEYQMKRLLSGGLPAIFQVARSHRSGECGQRHNPEFSLVEWYRVGLTMHALIDETEALVRTVLDAHGPLENCPLAEGPCDWSEAFERISVTEAFERYGNTDQAEMLRLSRHDEERFFRILIEEVEPAFARLGRPVFLYHYPLSQASLARPLPADPRLCERFELYFGALELCNGFRELTDPQEQRARFEDDQRARSAMGKPVYPIDARFLAALQEGMPDASGNALGLDRLIALCCGSASIADVMAFSADHL